MLWVLLLLGQGNTAFAYYSRVFDHNSGLTVNSVNDLAIGADGMVWVTSHDGLYRIASHRVRRIDRQQEQRLITDNSLIRVRSIGDHTLFVAGEHDLFLFDILHNRAQLLGRDRFPQYQRAGSFAVTPAQDNVLWFINLNGQLHRLDLEQSSLTQLADIGPQVHPFQALVRHNNTLVTATREQLLTFSMDGRLMERRRWDSGQGTLTTLFVDRQQRLWLASTRGLYLYRHGQFELLDAVGRSVRDMAQDSQGNLWVLSTAGLHRVEPDTLAVTSIGRGSQVFDGNSSMHKLVIDDHDQLWIATLNDGLVALSQPESFLLDRLSTDSNPPLTNEMVWGFWGSSQALYVSTEQGLDRVDLQSRASKAMVMEGLDSLDSVFSVAEMSDSALMVGTSKGLFRLDKDSGVARRFAVGDDGRVDLSSRVILSLSQGQDRVWIATDIGLYLYRGSDDSVTPVTVSDQLVTGVRNVLDLGGQVWLGGKRRLGVYDPETGEYESRIHWLPDGAEQYHFGPMAQIGPGRFLMGSFGEGVFEIDEATQTGTYLNKGWRLNCTSPYFIAPIATGALIGCPQILARYDSDSGTITSVGGERGLMDTELNEGGVHVMEDGTVMVATTSGAWRVDPQRILARDDSFAIQLESIKIQYDDGLETYLMPESQPIEVKPNFELVSIALGTTNLLSAKPVNLRYQLAFDGRLSSLTELQGESTISLSRLPAGSHELLIFAEFDGVWQAEPLRLPFVVKQYWWLRQGMQLLFVTAAMLLLFLMAVNWRNQLRSQRRINQALQHSQHRLQLALQGGGSDIWEWDVKSDSFYVENRQSALSHSDRPMRIPRVGMSLHQLDRALVVEAWFALLKGEQERINIEFRAVNPIGEWRWLWVTGTVIERDPETGQALLVAGVYSDKTKVRKMAHLHTLYAHAVENTTEGMLILDADYVVTAHNASALSILGYDHAGLDGLSLSQHILCDDTVLEELSQSRRWSGEASLRRQNGTDVSVWLNLSYMSLDNDGEYQVVLFSDITQRKNQELELQKLANFDLVTGLPNRSQFSQLLDTLMTQDPDQPLALLFLDLDRFKHINDTFGHGTGDALLVEVSRLLAAVVGHSGTVCRFGGDEFVILMRGFNYRLEVEALAERVLSALSEPIKVQQQVMYQSASIGIALYPEDGGQPEELLKNADLAMYHAKEEGRGRVCFYTRERDARATYQLEMENELRQALEQGRLTIHYQPLVELSDRSVCGVEALMRWNRSDGTPVSPDVFIELAESSGLIIRLDRWMLENACREFMSWPDNRRLKLSINVSASHFRQYDYVEFIQSMLERTGMPPSQLCLEITEGVLMQQINLAQAHLVALRELGISVAVDDFGTGYSSLSYLSQFAVNSLKIDRSFIQSMLENKANRAITCSILDLGRNLELDVVAEGVETDEQLAFLKRQGCHLVQGFYFARPMAASACCRWLAERASASLVTD
ncbi:EAL domain-containing protein [Ferrimonas sediminum]|uniref:EAL domain-containing protein n=1 Tax=Ferrimonas sediminum TaxID=718193 RepID=UPI000B80BED3|nr:EAL domain-containing protein [Ferrimonas sediminum]